MTMLRKFFQPIVAAFRFTDPLPVVMAREMIESARRAMPGIRIVQMTDDDTPKLRGVDETFRLSLIGRDFICWTFMLFTRVQEKYKRVIWLDYDVIVQRDLRAVFDLDFDVALTKRSPDDRTVTPELLTECPHNMGVSFSRPGSLLFWNQAYFIYNGFAKPDGWMDGQRAIEAAINFCPSLQIVSLPCSVYNYTPLSESEDVSERQAVHYKGTRKVWIAGAAARAAADDIAAKMEAGRA